MNFFFFYIIDTYELYLETYTIQYQSIIFFIHVRTYKHIIIYIIKFHTYKLVHKYIIMFEPNLFNS